MFLVAEEAVALLVVKPIALASMHTPSLVMVPICPLAADH